jgi:GDP-L-fucose synthase
VRRLTAAGAQVLTVGRTECDLRDQAAVHTWVAEQRPEAVFIAAALVGGIEANRTRPAEFLYDN